MAPSDLSELLRDVITAADPTVRLRAIAQLHRELDAAETEAAADALRAGLSWREIGLALGISKQAAHRRHGKEVGEIDRAASTEDADNAAVVSGEVRRAVRLAHREAASAGALSTGTEHLLLGLLQCGDVSTTALLGRLGVTAAAARSAIESTIEVPLAVAQQAVAARDEPAQARERTILSPLARQVVAHALAETVQRGSHCLEVLDLLYAVVRHDRGGAAQTLVALGVSPTEVRTEIMRNARVSDRAQTGSPGQER